MTDQGIPIIYVHLGELPAPHLIDSIRQAKRAAPDTPVYAVLSENTAVSEGVAAAGATAIRAESLARTPDHALFLRSVRRRLGKKRGFWRFATERFFCVEELMQQLSVTRAVHLESDNLIYFDPARIGYTLAELYAGLAAPFANDELCVPGVVYVSSIDTLSQLNAYIARRINQAADERVRWYRPRFIAGVRMGIVLHDMNLLADFRRAYGADALDILPMVPSEYRSDSSLPHTYDYSHGFDRLGMIFDGLAIGPHHFGHNPKEHTQEGGAALIRSQSFINGDDFDFTGLDMRRPAIRWQGRTIPVASIHNAAKMLLADMIATAASR